MKFLNFKKDNYGEIVKSLGIDIEKREFEQGSASEYMVRTFLGVSPNLTPLINHALAQFIAKKTVNVLHAKGVYEFDRTVSNMYEYVLSFISNNNKVSYILDIEHIKDLIFKYADYYNMISYHEAVPSIEGIKEGLNTGITDYGFVSQGLSNVMPASVYTLIVNNQEKFAGIQIATLIGCKSLMKENTIED